MSTSLKHRARTAAARLLSRFDRDNRGVAAVEFAMIVPIMFFLFVGAIEFSQALTVDRRVTQAASSTADLISRTDNKPTVGVSLTEAEVDGQLKIIEQLIEPYDLSALTVKIYSVEAKGNPANPASTNYVVNWSRDNRGGTPLPRNSPYSGIPSGLLAPGEFVIVAEATYNYTPLIFKYFIKSAFDLKETFYLKPRNAACIKLNAIPCIGS